MEVPAQDSLQYCLCLLRRLLLQIVEHVGFVFGILRLRDHTYSLAVNLIVVDDRRLPL